MKGGSTMKLWIVFTFVAFIAILVVAYFAAEKANPKMIDVDPATMKVELAHPHKE
jgi:hypothetical protein